ncbi:MAG: hypothetical protein CM1200mP25_2110 [Acidobacteriota bacterium]|nr:MAG: hypothetical protein CM1200mP25_2110 [Acidobacteriota bacterium]
MYAVGVNGHFHAVDAQTGALRWSHNLVELFGLVDYNAFASSAVAYEGLSSCRWAVVTTGLLRSTGKRVPSSGKVSHSLSGLGHPDLFTQWRRPTGGLGSARGGFGLDPRDGGRLWHQPHANDLGLNLSMPVWSTQQRLFISSAYNGGSRMIQLQSDRTGTTVQELWHTNRTRLHFSNAIEIGNLVIGSSGDFGPAS